MTCPNPPASSDDPSSPASRLPPELLVKIFECLIDHSSPTILLRICHRWADVASSVSALWSRIDFSTPPSPLLQRCINQPIDVILLSSPAPPTSDQRTAVKDVLFCQHKRIRTLVLDLPANHLQAIEPELSATFPILSDVSLSVWYGTRAFHFPVWKPAAIPPSPIRQLRLLHVKTPWVMGRFQNLGEFFLHNQPYARFDPPMEVFLGILESSPQLTVLSVANAGPRLPLVTTVVPPARRVIHLHNLEHLYLEQEDVRDIGWMLVHLNIPVSAKVGFYVELDDIRPPVPLGPLLELALPNHPGFPHLTGLHRCTYLVDSVKSCVLTAPNFAFKITWDEFIHRHFDGLMMPFLRRVVTAGAIEDLTVIHTPPWVSYHSTLQWNQIFGTLPSLRRLKVERSPGGLDVSMWAVFQNPPSPALRELRLSFLVFTEGQIGKDGDGSQEGSAEKLVDYCAERNRRGCRLEHLVLEAPLNLPPDLALLLAPFVDCLEIREEASSDGDIRAPEFGARVIFDSLLAGR